MSLKKLILILAIGVMVSGCVTAAGIVSKDGRAYVVDGHVFGTDVYVCDATDGNPECWPVTEEERE